MSTILFKELAGSPVETFGPEGMKAERRLLCAYEDRHAVVTALLGGGNSQGRQPQAFYPGHQGVVAMRVRVEPFEKQPDNQGTFDNLTGNLNSYSGQFVLVVVSYDLLTTDTSHPNLPGAEAGTVLTYRMDTGGEYLVLPGPAVRWESDSTLAVPPDSVPTLRVPIIEHTLTWHRVALPPWDAIRDCVGAVNADSFLGAPPGTVLLDGAKAHRQFTGLDDMQQPLFGWCITYLFREKSIKLLADGAGGAYGWNHAYCTGASGGPQWDKLVDASGNPLYRAADFAPLFSFAQS